MRFISPKTDFAFKKIFASDESHDILISFLNAIIYSGNRVIKSLEIINPYNPANIVDLKDSYLDVRAVLADETTVIIEMQVWNVEAFEKRVIYNLCKTFVNQLKSGQGYSYLNPVIALTITDFQLFPSTEKVITRFHFQEEEEDISYQEKTLKMVFVELPKFTKKLEDLESLADKWIYFLKEAPSLEVIPPKMQEIPQIEKAMNIANQAGLSVEELEELHKEELFLEDRRGEITLAKREGREEGREEGIIQGERMLLLRQIERRFGKLTSAAIVVIEGLNSQDLERLSEAMWDFSAIEDLVNWLEEYSG
ncbi:Rpn family recombination-promoting nuclease/putative transposase [Limnofasciculus baicalensis]|uniref:Rpn family recombination-promoting nuclease/putative transposase n=1 Tax=Limnofasciculus baicalensis BBK-W-15 TaxID=2699891 RepID=A0AAE3GXZ6_9CYAN|nr:Rpn family recombination-promoting nuclease/putative transposase [Limnofasciculus baicalensis]MCP2731886.1 Rpn family recombination-promoting nuclease/putative transposase [Limnofasciculus baicalensis BBK-W-15]